MGVAYSYASSIWERFFGFKELKVIIVGLNNAGKTTTLYKLLLDEVVSTAPTIGSNVEEVTYKNMKFVMWDIGGQEAVRASWSTYYTNTHAVFLVVDSTDRDRIGIVKDELNKMLGHESLKEAKILVYANKQDLKRAMTAAEISDGLGLNDILDKEWHIQPCCALTGDGLIEGMEWLSMKLT